LAQMNRRDEIAIDHGLTRINERINRFLYGFIMGTILGGLFCLLAILHGAGGSPPLPHPENNTTLPASESTEDIKTGWINDTALSSTMPAGASEPGGHETRPTTLWVSYPLTQGREWASILRPENNPPPPDVSVGDKQRINDIFSLPAEPSGVKIATGGHFISTDWLDELVDKIWQQESSGRLNPPDGDNGRAIGPFQIHQEALTDVNQRFGLNYALWDMRDIERAKLVAKLYIAMHLDNHLEEISSMIFHYGPAGWRGKDVDGYWEKIKNIK